LPFDAANAIQGRPVIRDRIEAAYGVFELKQAMKTIVPG
jgi:hypothetical protein